MTARQALTKALSTMHETDASRYEGCAVEWTNTVLGELFDIARCRLAWLGMPEPEAVPQIAAFDDELPYDDELNLRVIPAGLLARIYSEEGDPAMLSLYRQEYAAAAGACERGTVKLV